MPKNHNVVQTCTYISGLCSHAIFGSSLATCLTSYVTFVKVEQELPDTDAARHVIDLSTAASDTASSTGAASTAQKLRVVIPSANTTHLAVKTKQIPNMPDSENPLFTIAESKFFSAYLASVAGASSPVHVFAQYYDQ